MALSALVQAVDRQFHRAIGEDAGRLLNELLDAGVSLIDTSVDYGRSEELIGRHLSSRRSEFFLASKCGCPVSMAPEAVTIGQHDYSAANVRADVEQSLRRLQTDHLDLEAAKLDELLKDGMNRHEFILRFTLSHPGVSSAIVGTSHPEHLRVAAAQLPGGQGGQRDRVAAQDRPASTITLAHSTGSREGTTASVARIIPVPNSPLNASTPTSPTTNWANNTPSRAVEIPTAAVLRNLGLRRCDQVEMAAPGILVVRDERAGILPSERGVVLNTALLMGFDARRGAISRGEEIGPASCRRGQGAAPALSGLRLRRSWRGLSGPRSSPRASD